MILLIVVVVLVIGVVLEQAMWKPPDNQGKVPAGRQPRCVTGSRLLLAERMRWKVSSPLVELPSLLAVPPAATRTRSRTMTRAVNAAEQQSLAPPCFPSNNTLATPDPQFESQIQIQALRVGRLFIVIVGSSVFMNQVSTGGIHQT